MTSVIRSASPGLVCQIAATTNAMSRVLSTGFLRCSGDADRLPARRRPQLQPAAGSEPRAASREIIRRLDGNRLVPGTDPRPATADVAGRWSVDAVGRRRGGPSLAVPDTGPARTELDEF